MAYLAFNESLRTAGHNFLSGLKSLFDKDSWSGEAAGWNKFVTRKTEYFDSLYTLSRITKSLVKDIQKVGGYAFTSKDIDNAMSSREQFGFEYGTKYSNIQSKSATNYLIKHGNILTYGFKNDGHATCIKHIPAGGNKSYLLAITFDSDSIEHVEAVVKGTGIDAGLQLKQIPFHYDVSEYKKD